MTPNLTFIAAMLTAVMSSSAWPVFGPKVVAWKNRKKNAQERHNEVEDHRRELERDEWMRESKDAYLRVQNECKECHRDLQQVKDKHAREIGALRRELADVKVALLNRIEALDDILPYITNLPDDKLRELRAANRAHRQAVFRGRL